MTKREREREKKDKKKFWKKKIFKNRWSLCGSLGIYIGIDINSDGTAISIATSDRHFQ